eukprot:gene2714-3139_t
MVNSCIVIGCANRQVKGSKLGFYRLPKEPNRRRHWLAAIRRKQYNPPLGSDVRVCGKHFISGAASSDNRSPDYIPTVEMGYEKNEIEQASSVSSGAGRYARGLKREDAKIDERWEAEVMEAQRLSLLEANEAAASNKELPFEIIESVVEDVPRENEIIESVDSRDDDNFDNTIDALNTEVQSLRSEKELMGKALQSSKFSHQFLDSDNKVKFFTGIPSIACFLWLFKYVSPELPTFDAVVPEDVFFIVFVKLRLNLLHEDLGYRFGISKATVSRILNTSIPVIARKLRCFIHWPDKGDVLRTLPKVFKKCFPRCKTRTPLVDSQLKGTGLVLKF